MKESKFTISAYMAAIGSKGGKAGGEKKRRSPEHYRMLTAAREARRRIKPWSTKPQNPDT